MLSCDPSSLVVDALYDKSREQNIAVTYFYVDFAEREEQSPRNILGSLLKQILDGLKRFPEEIRLMLQHYWWTTGGRGLGVSDIVKMLQTTTFLQPTFICVDALNECEDRHRSEILDSLRQILEGSPNTRIFLTGRRHTKSEVERHLDARVAVLSIKPSNNDIVEYTRMRLSKDPALGAMDSGLEDEIIKSITENVPET